MPKGILFRKTLDTCRSPLRSIRPLLSEKLSQYLGAASFHGSRTLEKKQAILGKLIGTCDSEIPLGTY